MKPFWIVWLLLFMLACSGNENNKEETSKQYIEYLEKQKAQYPDSVGIQLTLLNLYDSTGQTGKAYSMINSLIKQDQSNYGLWFRKAQLEESMGDTSSAMQSYQTAIKIYNSPEAMLSLANLMAETKNKQALEITAVVLKMGLDRQTDAACYFIDGVYYSRTNHFSEALRAFDQAISVNYTLMEAYIEKGLLYFDRKDFRQALEIFTFAANVNNLYADAYYYMARCYEEMNSKDSALIRFEQALSLDKNLVEAKKGIERIKN